MNILKLLLKLLLEIVRLPFVIIAEQIKFEKEFGEIERAWEANSYYFEGGRYSKEFFDLVDGKIVKKHE